MGRLRIGNITSPWALIYLKSLLVSTLCWRWRTCCTTTNQTGSVSSPTYRASIGEFQNPTTVKATAQEEVKTPQQTPEGNPTNTNIKTGSKSLMSDPTIVPTMAVTDRKYSFNHSLPVEQTQGVDFNTRQ